MFGPALGGQAGFLAELTSACDASTSSSRGISIFAIGLGLSYTEQSDIYTLQNEKFEALQQTVSNATITAFVQTTLANDITTAENYVTAAEAGNFTSNINCALNEIETAARITMTLPPPRSETPLGLRIPAIHRHPRFHRQANRGMEPTPMC